MRLIARYDKLAGNWFPVLDQNQQNNVEIRCFLTTVIVTNHYGGFKRIRKIQGTVEKRIET